MATRTAAGLFDVSHMGEIEVRGPYALALVQHVTCNDAGSKLDRWAGALLWFADDVAGHTVDDLLVHKISDDALFPVRECRATRTQDFEHIKTHNRAWARKLKTPGRGIHSWRFRARRRWVFCSASPPDATGIGDPLLPMSLWESRRRRLSDRAHRLHREKTASKIYFARLGTFQKLWTTLLNAGSGEKECLPCGLGARSTCAWKPRCASVRA